MNCVKCCRLVVNLAWFLVAEYVHTDCSARLEVDLHVCQVLFIHYFSSAIVQNFYSRLKIVG